MHESTKPTMRNARLPQFISLAVVLSLVMGCGIAAQSPGPGTSARPTASGPGTVTSAPSTPGATESAGAHASSTPAGQSTPAATDTAGPSATPETPLPTNTGKVVWGNWPAYMQFKRSSGSFPMVDKFELDTGIDATYLEDINDNSEFFNIIQPDLALGNYTGYDLITPSDWMVERLIRLGYLEPLDYRLLPNYQANANPTYQNPWYDPGNVYSVPWQAGIVGIGYNKTLTGRDITSFDDLLDPAFSGNVGLFSEMIDTMCLAILSTGKECKDATIEDAAAAKDKILAAQTAGQVFSFYGNDYYDALARGDIAISMAWSGDITQMKLYDNPDVEFVIPDTGGLLFVDNMVIPKQSQAFADAHALMDFWYNVDNATMQTEWVGYFSPVQGVSERVLADAEAARAAGDEATAMQLEEVANTAIPTEEQLALIHQYKILTEQEETTWNNLFNEVLFH
jgi:spermidine/putrescine transport system substrate-binding protein